MFVTPFLDCSPVVFASGICSHIANVGECLSHHFWIALLLCFASGICSHIANVGNCLSCHFWIALLPCFGAVVGVNAGFSIHPVVADLEDDEQWHSAQVALTHSG